MFRKIITICLIILLLFTINGCVGDEKEIESNIVESEEEAQEAVIDVSEDLSDISDTLESINDDLG